MKQAVQGLWARIGSVSQAATRRNDTLRVQALLDELEDAPPNSLLLNMATGFPSALLCVLAAGALAGALAGRQVGGADVTSARASGTAQTVEALQPNDAPPSRSALPAGLQGALTGRQVRVEQLEQQALLAVPGPR